ncbi:sulfatase [Candidatus Binatia bacterium]|nr:sulfatase [Candidatus Binatia bacterium]
MADAVVLATPRLVRASAAASAARRRPYNVLVYLIDTLRADHTTPYGSERATTPRLAALARDGVVFANAYTVAPWTRPATASLLTGLYPSTHGSERAGALAPAAVTLAERFRRAGWSTWAFVANGHVFGEGVGLDQGFDRFVAVRGRRLDNHARSEEIAALVLPQLDAFGDEPFLLYVHAVDPHSPYDPPPTFAGRFRDPTYTGTITPADTLRKTLRARSLDESDVRRVRDLYDEDVAYQDEQLGVLLDALSERGLRERTIVVVLSDHGEELNDHGDWEHGMRLFEEQVRIPLIVDVPGLVGARARWIAEPAAIVDVLPTLLTLTGIAPGEPMQGVDLAPALTRSAASQASGGSRPGYFEEIRPGEDRDLYALRDGRWKIVREVLHASGESRDALFDLETDPLEREDLAAREPVRLDELRARLDAMPGVLAAQVAPLPAGAPSAPSAATRRQLEALGYVVPDGPAH